MPHRKGITIFLLITFGITYLAEGILAGWIHGVFNAQAYGIWQALLFASANPFLGGISGIVGIVVLLVLGLLTIRWVKRATLDQPPIPERALTEEEAAEFVATWTLLNH